MGLEKEKTDRQYLSWLMGPEEERFPGWSPEELGEILEHQLEALLAVDLGSPLLELDQVLTRSGRFQGLRSMSFEALLLHPSPPVEALDLVKEYAKARKNDPEHLLPVDVATLLYYGTIIAAALRLGAWISTLDRQVLRTGLDWALSQEWLEGPIRSLLEEGKTYIERQQQPPPAP